MRQPQPPHLRRDLDLQTPNILTTLSVLCVLAALCIVLRNLHLTYQTHRREVEAEHVAYERLLAQERRIEGFWGRGRDVDYDVVDHVDKDEEEESEGERGGVSLMGVDDDVDDDHENEDGDEYGYDNGDSNSESTESDTDSDPTNRRIVKTRIPKVPSGQTVPRIGKVGMGRIAQRRARG